MSGMNVAWYMYIYLVQISGSVQERHNCSALAMEFCIFCTKPSKY